MRRDRRRVAPVRAVQDEDFLNGRAIVQKGVDALQRHRRGGDFIGFGPDRGQIGVGGFLVEKGVAREIEQQQIFLFEPPGEALDLLDDVGVRAILEHDDRLEITGAPVFQPPGQGVHVRHRTGQRR